MKLMLKVVVVLAVLMASTVAYAEVPDVSKWSCPNAYIQNIPDHGAEITFCNKIGSAGFYVKVSGELIYIHEHRTDANKTVYYNALKNNKGTWWVEVVNKTDLIYEIKTEQNNNITLSIVDDNGVVVAKRLIPFLKK